MPGNNLELQAVDEERFTAAALFGLAGSEQGLGVLLSHPGQVLTGTTCKAMDIFRRQACPDIAAGTEVDHTGETPVAGENQHVLLGPALALSLPLSVSLSGAAG